MVGVEVKGGACPHSDLSIRSVRTALYRYTYICLFHPSYSRIYFALHLIGIKGTSLPIRQCIEIICFYLRLAV